MSLPKPALLNVKNKKLSATISHSAFAGWPCWRIDWTASRASMALIEKEIVGVRTNEPAKQTPDLVRKLEALDLTGDDNVPFGITQYVQASETATRVRRRERRDGLELCRQRSGAVRLTPRRLAFASRRRRLAFAAACRRGSARLSFAPAQFRLQLCSRLPCGLRRR